MTHALGKLARFLWRAARNAVCVTTWGRSLLFPSASLGGRFGPGDASYAINVFLHHYTQLAAAGFYSARQILEVGPGRNLGTSLLMWSLNRSRTGADINMVLWDVFPNMTVNEGAIAAIALALLESPSISGVREALQAERIEDSLRLIASGKLVPNIHYQVLPAEKFFESDGRKDFELVYSQAAVEHIWHVADFWRNIIRLTKPGGWHSHRIDLADHGRRDTNYIEMLEWSELGYWVTMRFVPGAINRWRASMHLEFVNRNGLKVLRTSRDEQELVPIPYSWINKAFRSLNELDLKTTGIDFVAIRDGSQT